MKKLLLMASTCLALTAFGQSSRDTSKHVILNEVEVSGSRSTVGRLPQTSNGYIWSGKKNEVINLEYADANIAEKTPRQIFAKVPGVFVYDMDGTGNQMNISTRGLDPHRGWEFNIRKNGIITNSDMYGYPASHYSLPMEAIGRIELVRGTGGLQYGAQFGGMLNYIMKQPDTTKAISLESVNSIGTYGLLSTYNAIGGKVGKFQYYAFYSKRLSDGYRDNSQSDYDGQSILLKYMPNKNVAITGEFSRSNYLYQIPGPLNDSMFQADPQMSTRARNYFDPEIYVPSITLDWALGENTQLKWVNSAVLGQRSSVQFGGNALTRDTIRANTLQYAPRTVDIDNFNSYSSELRLFQRYKLGQQMSSLSVGGQYFNNDLHRRQGGIGTTGTDYDLTIVPDSYTRDIHFKTQNVAFFAENLFQITPKFSVSPGVRVELGESNFTGKFTYLPDENEIPNTIEHRFPLFGINLNYDISPLQGLYAGFSQAYRPVILKDIVPELANQRADKDLKDANGYNAELGYRGTAGNLRWDVSLFRLQQNDRLGNQIIENDIIFRTNIGNSVTNGVEFFGEYSFNLGASVRCNIFSSTSFMDAKYEDAAVVVGTENKDVSGNKVESVPEWISRNGLNLKYKKFSLSFLYSYTAESFADPLNTVKPNATGTVGIVPSYALLDINASWRVSNAITVRLNFNNVTDEHYFTKRPTLYPGAAVWPSDGRTTNVSVGVKF